MQIKNTKKGFIALISTIIISVVTLVAVFSVGQKGIYSRFFLLDLERKSESEKLAQGCAEIALATIVNNASYTTSNLFVPLGKSNCRIVSVENKFNGTSEIKTSATSTGATTNLIVNVNNISGDVISWTEVPNL